METKPTFFSSETQAVPVAKTFMANVFLWMFGALVVTALTAFYFGTNEEFKRVLINTETGGISVLGWIVTLAPFGLVLLMSFGFQKLSASVMTLVFILFSVLMGMSLSFIFSVYTAGSIYKTFAVTAGMFGIMAVVGYTTKTDLTKFGAFLSMALIGIIISMLVNLFLRSGTLDYIVSVIGVLVFTGLTAYDVQKLKNIGAGIGDPTATDIGRKLSIMGALTLYLDFINLFLFLLRFLGNRK